jgi:hypothetical protein
MLDLSDHLNFEQRTASTAVALGEPAERQSALEPDESYLIYEKRARRDLLRTVISLCYPVLHSSSLCDICGFGPILIW